MLKFTFRHRTCPELNESEAKKLTGGLDSVLTPVNAYLIQTPDHIILVDTGIGGESGHLMKQLNDAGIDSIQS